MGVSRAVAGSAAAPSGQQQPAGIFVFPPRTVFLRRDGCRERLGAAVSGGAAAPSAQRPPAGAALQRGPGEGWDHPTGWGGAQARNSPGPCWRRPLVGARPGSTVHPPRIREPPVSCSVPGTRRACGAPLPAGLRRPSQRRRAAEPVRVSGQTRLASQHSVPPRGALTSLHRFSADYHRRKHSQPSPNRNILPRMSGSAYTGMLRHATSTRSRRKHKTTTKHRGLRLIRGTPRPQQNARTPATTKTRNAWTRRKRQISDSASNSTPTSTSWRRNRHNHTH